jgi:hypothetical protein
VTPRPRLRLLGIAALAAAATVVVLPGRKAAEHGDRPDQRPRVQRSRGTAPEPVAGIDGRDALLAARRFAAAYAAWDAGHRGPTVRRRLRATATAELIASLPRDAARPVARRAAPLRLSAVGAYRLAGRSYAVPLVLRERRSFQIVTLIVGPTPHGPRVTRLER